MAEKKPQPPISFKINPRFIYNVTRKIKKGLKWEYIITPALTADGYIDCAHQMGIGNVKTEIVDLETTHDPDGGITRWVTVMATIEVAGRTVTGLASTNSRNVQTPGFEVAVAETRALKRAIAIACNINETVINPSGEIPTREIVDLPIEEPEPESEIPEHVRKPMSEIIDADGGPQFEV
jgi:hypothetical protein